MTRKIDRLREQRRAEDVARAERSLFVDALATEGRSIVEDLRDALGIPSTMSVNFDTTPRPKFEFVHPRVYAQRAQCPSWTYQPNPDHVHNRDCS